MTIIRQELRDGRPRATEKSLRFVTADTVTRVMTKERVRDLLKIMGPEVEEQLDIIWKHLRQVLAILITIKWNGWPKFQEIFLRELDTFERPERSDHHLPFLDLTFLDEDVREEFDDVQYLFQPIIIQENMHLVYSEQFRLPFLKSEKRGSGAFGTITEELVEKKQIKYNNGVVKELNSKVRSAC